MAKANELWTGRVGFILATIGSAVGLGSIWKFPYEVGSNGGSAFIIFYLLGLALVVVPLMLAEFAIGRRGRSDAAESVAAVAIASGASRALALIGLLGVVTSFLILSFYSVIGGWALAYVVETVHQRAAGADARRRPAPLRRAAGGARCGLPSIMSRSWRSRLPSSLAGSWRVSRGACKTSDAGACRADVLCWPATSIAYGDLAATASVPVRARP